jgi:putative transposase
LSGVDRNEEIALFWYRLIAPLLDPGLSSEDRTSLLREILSKPHSIPASSRRSISRATLHRKILAYQQHGLSGLHKSPRSDKGKSRSIPPDLFEQAVKLRLDQPRRTTRRIIDLVEKAHGLEKDSLKLKTLARLFMEKGVTRQHLAHGASPAGFTSFAREHINELWMSDVMHGFALPDPQDSRKRRMTYLVAFLDDASRLIPHAEFFFDEKLPRLEITFKKAVQRRGIPHILYCDNGQIFHATQFELICAELSVRLIHSEPGRPEGRGKIERFFSTCQTDFLSEAKAKGPHSLHQLNEWFWAWLEMAYHHKIHASLGTTPLAFWLKEGSPIRLPDPDRLDTIFLWRNTRVVSKVHTFSLEGNGYEVDASLAGQEIEIRFNPFDLTKVLVFRNGAFVMRARACSVPQPFHSKAPSPPPRPTTPLTLSYLDTLVEQYEKHLKKELGSLDFQTIQSKRRTTLEEAKTRFVAALTQHIGRPLASIEIASARGLLDELGSIDLDRLAALPREAIPDPVTFGKLLNRLRSLVLERRSQKGNA